MNMNTCVLGGYLTREVECRYTSKGTAVAKFSIALNRTWTDDAGEKHEKATFVECEAWDRLAENITKFFHKGEPILIRGRLDMETWEDKATHAKRSKLKVVVETFSFVTKMTGDQSAAPASRSTPATASSEPPPDDFEEPPF